MELVSSCPVEDLAKEREKTRKRIKALAQFIRIFPFQGKIIGWKRCDRM
jgi:hypothetical protein